MTVGKSDGFSYLNYAGSEWIDCVCVAFDVVVCFCFFPNAVALDP